MVSLKEKVGQMNGLGIKLANTIEHNPDLFELLTSDETDTIYGVADGLTEEFVMQRIEGRCSLQAMLDWSCDKLEGFVDTRLKELHNIGEKLLLGNS
jgi:hypothetical protein